MFSYHQPNLENMQTYLANEGSSEGSGINWWSIPSGMSSVRILPPWDPSGRVALPVYMHPIEFKGKDMSFTKYNWTCTSKTSNKPCRICEGLAKLSEAGVDISNWEANRRQFYFNAVVMVDPTYDAKTNKGTAPGTHVLMKAPKTFYDWVISQITNPMIGDITNPQNGIDVYITKTGSGLGTEYSMTLSPNGRTAIPPEYLEKITDLYNLDDIFSSGFDQDQVNEMVDHLGRSAGVMRQSVTTTSNQMAGYNQAPAQVSATQQFTVPPAQTQVPPWQASVPPMQAPNPPVQPVTPASPATPAVPWSNSSTAGMVPPPTAPAQENLPKCFGNYDPGNVNCVVCPQELNCSKSK